MSESLFAAAGSTSNYVTTDTNVTGQMTPVLEIQPDDGVGLVIHNAVDVGQKRQGFPIYADLRDSNDNPLPLDTVVAIGYESPTHDNIQVVSTPLSNISSYIKKSIKEQQNRENVDSVKHELKNKRLEVRDIDAAYVMLNSSTQIDHANSEIYVDNDAVDEVDIE
ncbi:hypothetical protein [Haloarchaeobius litoreus]|uniref:Uncharacterized protein n=1 Tax=Haloarchaeobius litoreus TaxID=755306 RepID=A0ABD6DH63_9EURY|nr:hypothetical protein [Haloarchaeobius litoreus]